LRKTCIIAAVLLVTSACSKAPGQQTGATPPAPSTAAAGGPAVAAPATAAAPGQTAAAPPAVKPVPATLPDIVARVNGDPVSKMEFENAIRSLEAQAGQGVPYDKRNEVYRQVLDQLVGYKLLIQESKARKLVVADAEIDSQIAQMRKQFPDEDAFTKALAEQQLDVNKLRENVRSQMLVSRFMEMEIGPSIQVTDADIQAFYDQNKAQFNQPETMRASHILIRFPENADEAAKSQARTRADAVLTKLKAGGNFAALAKEFSQDAASAANGGDLGFFAKAQMPPAFGDVAFTLKPGQMSGLVESQVGYHIIKAAEHRAARVVPLTEASAEIRQFLTQQQQQEKAEAYVNTLKAKAKIEILI
jgi:peptidyl-prolyl cis-trans isomerase C